MFTNPVVVILLIISGTSGVFGYQNGFDGHLFVECNTYHGEALYRVQSHHNNRVEDRQWHWYCRSIVPVPMPNCTWTNYVNTWDQPFSFHCPADYVLSGVSSYHNNVVEDRRWRFKCCRANGYYTQSCTISGYINGWDGYMDYSVGNGIAFTGAFSYHDNRREDRLWKINYCRYKD